jgi:radical SAM protein with 4Fe4S-binding SPASM domain
MKYKRYIRRILEKIRLFQPIKSLLTYLDFSRINYNHIKDTGEIGLPTHAKWEPTMRCNLKCRMCHQADRRKSDYHELNFEEAKSLIDNLANAGIKSLLLVGGEIFVRKDIFEILEYLMAKGIECNIITNGTLINEQNIERLLACTNIYSIDFSIDGLKETHDDIRGVKNTFNRAIKAIELINNKFIVTISCVVQKRNIKEIKELILLAKQLNVDSINFILEMFSTEDELNISKKMMDVEDIDTYGNYRNIPTPDYSIQELKEVLKIIKGDKKTQLTTKIANKYPEEFYYGTIRQTNLKLICGGLKHLYLDNHGNVLLCPYIKKGFGNILHTPLKEIWNCEEFKEFRKRLLHNNLIPICQRCCGLDYIGGI